MPDVGGVKFPYTKEGIAKAKAWSQMTGDPIKMEKKGKGGGIPIDQYSKKMSSKYKKGGQLKPVDADKNPGLAKLPEKVRNKMGYMQKGGYAEFNPGDATITQREATIQEMMSPEYQERIANLVMGSLGGGGNVGLLKMLKNLLKKPKKNYFSSGDPKFTRADAKKLNLKDQIKKLEAKQKADADWAKAKEKMIKAGRKDAPATGRTYRPFLDPNVNPALKIIDDSTIKFAGGGKIPQKILLRLMFALGGVIPDGRRMYSMGGKKKPRKK